MDDGRERFEPQPLLKRGQSGDTFSVPLLITSTLARYKIYPLRNTIKDESHMLTYHPHFSSWVTLFIWKDPCECNRGQFWQDLIILDKLPNFKQNMNAKNYTPSQLAKKEQVLWVCLVFNSVLLLDQLSCRNFQIRNGQLEWKHAICIMVTFLMIKYTTIMKIKFSASGMC